MKSREELAETMNKLLVAEITVLMEMVQVTGEQFVNDATLVEEHGATEEQLRKIVALHGRAGSAMVRAANRSRDKHEGAPLRSEKDGI